MIEPDLELPEALRERINTSTIGESGLGRLGNQLVRVTDKEHGPAYLKIATGAAGDDLRQEAGRLEWIGAQLPVPEVLHFDDSEVAYLLLKEMPGTPSFEWIEELGPEALLDVLAGALRDIHAVSTIGCPFDGLFEREIAEAEKRLAAGDVDTREFLSAAGMRPSEALDWLRAHEDLVVADRVFTHGDFCMPNILMSDGELSGLLDWGLAGIADVHRDLMSVEVTLRRNLDLSWRGYFYDAYGLTDVDDERIKLYSVLDQFF